MKFPSIIRQVMVAVACLVILNIALVRLTRNAIGRVHARMIRSASPCTDLFVGHSLIAGGIDTGSFDAIEPGRKSLNIGLNSTGPVEHYLMLDQASSQNPSRLYYGILDDQLTRGPEQDPESVLIGNRGFVYYGDYFDVGAGAGMYSKSDVLKYCMIRAKAHVPMLREQGTMWQKVEHGRRWLGAIGMPRARMNRFGREEDMVGLVADPRMFAAGIRQAVDARVPLSSPVLAMLEWAMKRGTASYILLMPVTSVHRAKYYTTPEWARYRDYVAGLVTGAGGHLIDSSDWFDDDVFEDQIHLNPAGAIAFSERLGRWVAERPSGECCPP